MKMLKHSKEGDETKLKILKAAKKEFAEKGFNGARMSSIASIAGVNQALLHYHFENKENLYRSIFHNTIGDIASEFSEQLSKEIDSWNPTPDIKLCAAIYIMVSINMDSHDDELHRIFAREMAEGQGLLHEFVKNYMMPRLLIFEDIIKDGVAREFLRYLIQCFFLSMLWLLLMILPTVRIFLKIQQFMKNSTPIKRKNFINS